MVPLKFNMDIITNIVTNKMSNVKTITILLLFYKLDANLYKYIIHKLILGKNRYHKLIRWFCENISCDSALQLSIRTCLKTLLIKI